MSPVFISTILRDLEYKGANVCSSFRFIMALTFALPICTATFAHRAPLLSGWARHEATNCCAQP